MWNKFKNLPKGKQVGMIAGLFILLSIVAPTPKSSNNSSVEFTEEQVKSALTVDTTEIQPIIITETKTEANTEPIPFETITKNDSTIEKGRSVKSVKGVSGTLTINYEVNYRDGVQVSRNEVSREITTNPVTEVILTGTKVAYTAPAPVYSAPSNVNCDPNYTPCVPNSSSDLDCPDAKFMVQVIGRDRHRFDRDKDGYGCESYR